MSKMQERGYDRKYRFALDAGVVTCVPEGRYSNAYTVYASDGVVLGRVVCHRDTNRAVTKKNWFAHRGEHKTGPYASLMKASEQLLESRKG